MSVQKGEQRDTVWMFFSWKTKEDRLAASEEDDYTVRSAAFPWLPHRECVCAWEGMLTFQQKPIKTKKNRAHLLMKVHVPAWIWALKKAI